MRERSFDRRRKKKGSEAVLNNSPARAPVAGHPLEDGRARCGTPRVLLLVGGALRSSRRRRRGRRLDHLCARTVKREVGGTVRGERGALLRGRPFLNGKLVRRRRTRFRRRSGSAFLPPPLSAPTRASPRVYGARKLRCELVLEHARRTARGEREQRVEARTRCPTLLAPPRTMREREIRSTRSSPSSLSSRSCRSLSLHPASAEWRGRRSVRARKAKEVVVRCQRKETAVVLTLS